MIQNGQPVSYASKSLTDTESRYSNIEREMLGVVFALTRFHQYTYGRAVTVVTDHKPLESLNKRNINDCPARLQRMLLRLQCYTFTIVYRPGSKIPVPDCLSRLIHNRQDPEIPGMHIQVNDVTPTHPSKLDIIRNHMKISYYSVTWSFVDGRQTDLTCQQLFCLTGHIRMSLPAIMGCS